MEMAVAAKLHLVGFQHGQDLRALVALIQGWIVEEAEDGLLPRRLQRSLQPQQLPVQHLGIVGLLLLLQKPAPCAADGVTAVEKAVVVQQFQGGEAIGLTKGAELGGGGPPVIVVALDEIFFAGKLLQKPEILHGFLKTHSPGGVSHQHQHILRRQLAQGRPDPLCIVLPRGAEHLHGLVAV